MRALSLSLRMLRRDWRAGELRILILAVVVAVAGVTAVNVFTDRIQRALAQQAHALLGGDLVISASHSLPARYLEAAKERQLDATATQVFPSMVMMGERTQLVTIKAVAPGFPLRGQLRVAEQLFSADYPASGIPEPGSVWAESRLLTALDIGVGDRLMVGAVELTVAAVLSHDPTQASGMLFSLAPSLLLNRVDLAATQLIQPASRVRYQHYFAGTSAVIEGYRRWLEPQLQAGEALQDLDTARPEVRTALARAQRFLGLAAMVSVLLAGVAVAMAVQRFVRRHLDSCAVMRCLGARQGFISRIYIYQMVMLGLGASVLGVAVGYLAQGGLVVALGSLLETELPAPSLVPAVWGGVTGMVTLVGFGMPPLLRLHRVPALRVLRRELGGSGVGGVVVYGLGAVALALLVFIQAGDLTMTLLVLLGLALTLLVLGGVAWGLVLALKSLRGQMGVAWRFGLANIGRRAGVSVVQVVGFGLGIMALLLLTLVRSDLIDQWQARLPVDAPNRFLINIQPQQVAAVEQFLTDRGVGGVRLHPMVRGRLAAINGEPVSAEQFDGERAQRLLLRAFNLSWAAQPQADNRIVAGQWWQPQDAGKPWVSLEVGLAKTLGLHVGDTLTFQVGGEVVSVYIANLRTVAWDSFQANFFVLAAPGVLDQYPATYMTSFYLPDEQMVLDDLVGQFPNITVIDIAAVMDQVRHIVERVSLAVEYVFLFTLLAGLMVMYAAIHASLDERIQEIAILKTLGAKEAQLMKGLMAEFGGLGLLAGVVAAVAASAISGLLAVKVFDLDYELNLLVGLSGVVLGGVGIGIAGTLSTRSMLKQPPLWVLRKM